MMLKLLRWLYGYDRRKSECQMQRDLEILRKLCSVYLHRYVPKDELVSKTAEEVACKLRSEGHLPPC